MEGKGILELDMLINIIVAIAAGFLSRLSLLKVDYRQYPTFPNGYLIHLTVGFIASAAGAIVIPALLAKNFTAVTFLFLAIQQFREVRNSEFTSLQEIDKTQYYPRGPAYIDGIAKSFESRNYIAVIVSMTTIIVLLISSKLPNKIFSFLLALLAALIVHMFVSKITKGKSIKDIADVTLANISFKDNNLFVNDIYVMNVGLEVTKKRIQENGIGVILKPAGENERIMINSIGQRQAILHECSRLLGLERYAASRREFDSGDMAFLFVPIRKEPKSLLHIIENVPLLEELKKQAHKV